MSKVKKGSMQMSSKVGSPKYSSMEKIKLSSSLYGTLGSLENISIRAGKSKMNKRLH